MISLDLPTDVERHLNEVVKKSYHGNLLTAMTAFLRLHEKYGWKEQLREIDEAYAQLTGNLSDQDRDDLAKQAAKMAVLIKAPERVRAVCEHIVQHFQDKVEPNGFKAQIVTFDRECCVLYKKSCTSTNQ